MAQKIVESSDDEDDIIVSKTTPVVPATNSNNESISVTVSSDVVASSVDTKKSQGKMTSFFKRKSSGTVVSLEKAVEKIKKVKTDVDMPAAPLIESSDDDLATTPLALKTTTPLVPATNIAATNITVPEPESVDDLVETSSTLVAPMLATPTMPTTTPSSGDGDHLTYNTIATTLHALENISSRLEMQVLLTTLFRKILASFPDDLLATVYLVSAQLAPPFEGVQIGIGDSILIKAISECTGRKPAAIKKEYLTLGDLGSVAQKSRSGQKTLGFSKPKALTVQGVYKAFLQMAAIKGNKSGDKKIAVIKKLFVSSKEHEPTFLIRGLQGKLRIGVSEKTVLTSLAHALVDPTLGDDEAAEEKLKAVGIIKKAFAECPSLDQLIPAVKTLQAQQLPLDKLSEHCHLLPNVPVSPMLARPTKSYHAVFDRLSNAAFTCEYKYDGERAQIHISDAGATIKIFSRNFEDSSERFPDVIAALREKVHAIHAAGDDTTTIENAIIDSEVVAYDPERHLRLPFQVLSTRARKDVTIASIKVPVCVYLFDMLYLNHTSLLQDSLASRRSTLYTTFGKETKGTFEYATYLDIANDAVDDNTEAGVDLEEKVDLVRTFLATAVKAQCEGLMVKTQEATYEPANRSHKWLKLKKDYLDGIGDSVDLVPVGAFSGKGKRTGVYGAYLLASYDPETEMFQLITKLGTGLSDEALKQFHTEMSPHIRPTVSSDVAIGISTELPDVWFEPSVVWEILGADLSISPKYNSAVGHVVKDKGISLRFPRFIRERPDKKPVDATTSAQIADLYRAQGLITENKDDEDEDEDAL